MNGHADISTTETRSEPTSRLHDRPNISVVELAAMQRGYVERLGKLIEQLAAVMSRPDPPTAAIGSPAPARDVVTRDGREHKHDARLGRLTRTLLADGSAAYTVGTDLVRSTVARLLGKPAPAFVERGPASASPYLELTGSKDHEIAAAMAFAANRWGTNDVIIHVDGRHAAKVVEHAVASGVNIANTDGYIRYLVARARERHANPLTRQLPDDVARRKIAVLEKAPSAPGRSRS